MACGKPLFAGSTVREELQLIFKGLGSPPPDCWPDLTIPYTFPHYTAEPLVSRAPRLDADAIDLLGKFLCVSIVNSFLSFLIHNKVFMSDRVEENLILYCCKLFNCVTLFIYFMLIYRTLVENMCSFALILLPYKYNCTMQCVYRCSILCMV